MVAPRHSWPFTRAAAQVRSALRTPAVPLALVTGVLAVAFGTLGSAAALALWSLHLVRVFMRCEDRRSGAIPEGLPRGTHWLVVDSPLAWVAAERVCRAIESHGLGATGIVLDLRSIGTLRGLPGASPARLLATARAATSRIVVVASDALMHEFAHADGVSRGGCVYARTAAAAVAYLRS